MDFIIYLISFNEIYIFTDFYNLQTDSLTIFQKKNTIKIKFCFLWIFEFYKNSNDFDSENNIVNHNSFAVSYTVELNL